MGRLVYIDAERGSAYWREAGELVCSPLMDNPNGGVEYDPAPVGAVEFDRLDDQDRARLAAVELALTDSALIDSIGVVDLNVEGFGPPPATGHPDPGERPIGMLGEDNDWRVTAFRWGAVLEVNIGGVGLISLNLQHGQVGGIAAGLASAGALRRFPA